MANTSLLILDSFAFTIESLKYSEAAKNYYQRLGAGSCLGDGGESEKCLSSKVTALKASSSSSPNNNTSTTTSVKTVQLHESQNKLVGKPSSSTTGKSEPSSVSSSVELLSSQLQTEAIPSLSTLSQQIAKAREQIQASLQAVPNSISSLGSGALTEEDLAMREENTRLKKQVDDLENQVQQLRDRVTKLELAVGCGKGVSAPAQVKSSGDAKPPAKKDDDDDVDLFGSDEEDSESAKIREQRLAEYAAKKSKKPALVAKSNVILDVKPWDDETDMAELEKAVRTIQMDGLLFGASKLVPLAYGIKKLQITTVIEDDKVSVEELTEKIEAFEDFVQSVDIAAFNKI